MSNSKDEGLIDSVKKTLIDRINTPLFGFIVLSWVVFNWELLLTVIFSKQMISSRIAFVKSSYYYPFKMFIYPAIYGFLLSVAFPYLQFVVSFLQRLAQKLNDEKNVRRESDECKATIKLASDKADAESSMDIERARKKLEIAKKEEEIATVKFNIEQLESLYNQVSGLVDKAKADLKNNETLYENIKGDLKVVQKRVDELNVREKQLLNSIADKEKKNDTVHLLSGDIERVVGIMRGYVMSYRKKLKDEGIAEGEPNSSNFSTPDIEGLDNFIESIERGINEIHLISTENVNQIAFNKN